MQKITGKAARPYKGRSLIDFPSRYVVVDIETTGMSPGYCEIIEISAVRYADGEEVDSFETLIKPSRSIDYFITQLTGISNAMVAEAPDISDSILEFYSYIGDDILIGYNVNFDVNFLYDNLMRCHQLPLANSFVDVLRIARRVLKSLPNHKQTTVAEYYGISTKGAHRAKNDCEICNAVFLHLQEDICAAGSSLEEFKGLFKQ